MSSIATINEFHNFKKAYGTQTGANVGECRTFLRDRLVGVWTGAAFDEPIEELWSGGVRSGAHASAHHDSSYSRFAFLHFSKTTFASV